jgi:MFS family permease
MAFILFGYDQGVFSGIVGNADFLDTFDHPSAALEGIIVSIYNLGCFTGCILTFALCEKTGRKLAMWIAMGWIIVSGLEELEGGWEADQIGRRSTAGFGVLGAAYDGRPIHNWNRNWGACLVVVVSMAANLLRLKHRLCQCISLSSVKLISVGASWPLSLSSLALAS